MPSKATPISKYHAQPNISYGPPLKACTFLLLKKASEAIAPDLIDTTSKEIFYLLLQKILWQQRPATLIRHQQTSTSQSSYFSPPQKILEVIACDLIDTIPVDVSLATTWAKGRLHLGLHLRLRGSIAVRQMKPSIWLGKDLMASLITMSLNVQRRRIKKV